MDVSCESRVLHKKRQLLETHPYSPEAAQGKGNSERKEEGFY